MFNSSLQYQPMITTNIGDYGTLQYVSIIHLLIYLIDIKHVQSSLQYQSMITTNIGDYETIQMVSKIHLLIETLIIV